MLPPVFSQKDSLAAPDCIRSDDPAKISVVHRGITVFADSAAQNVHTASAVGAFVFPECPAVLRYHILSAFQFQPDLLITVPDLLSCIQCQSGPHFHADSVRLSPCLRLQKTHTANATVHHILIPCHHRIQITGCEKRTCSTVSARWIIRSWYSRF